MQSLKRRIERIPQGDDFESDNIEPSFVNPPDPPERRVSESPSPAMNFVPPGVQKDNERAWQNQTSPGLGTRYKTHDMNVFEPAYKSYVESSVKVRTKMEREAVIANVLRRNKRKICEERGIPSDVFNLIWEEYRESHKFKGRFFHRDELVFKETTENAQRMQAAIAANRQHVPKGTAA
jgi:hypothetical protein